MSTFYFCELLTAHTKAEVDGDHLDMLISSRASTPDRTAFILGKSKESPLPVMQQEALRLANAGATLLVIPCNTAHYFYQGIREVSPIPILNIMEETVNHLSRLGTRVCGLLATEGTVRSDAYHRLCRERGITCLVPSDEEQEVVTRVIYEGIKQNKPIDTDAFLRVCQSLLARGCERLILGCTELSLLRRQGLTMPWYLDSLEVLAYRTILACGKTPIDFPCEFSSIEGDGV